ncbi:MAG: hypothetical protein JW963_10810 [Anaerolineales bacterium]|nr:hypothetical protein [Anaerolineales bacterium]
MMRPPQPVLDWLLEAENPSVRYRALTELLDVAADDPQVQQTRAQIPESQPVQKIFAKMHPDGYWLHRGKGAGIEYAMSNSTHFILAFLAELGLDRQDERIARAVERYLSLTEPEVSNPNIWQIPPDTRNHQSCLYAYNLRTFVMFGYHDDPRIQERIAVLLADERHDGGYLCDRPTFKAKTKSCIRGSIKALMAFAALPELWETARCYQLVDYFLRRRVLFRTRQPEMLVRGELVCASFPFVIGGNLLEPLYALSRMGYGQDERLQSAWTFLDSKREGSGRYILDWHPQTLFKPGNKGQPNKWVTLYAYLAHKYQNTTKKRGGKDGTI